MVWGVETLLQRQAVLCVVWGPSPAVGLSWRSGGGVGFSDSESQAGGLGAGGGAWPELVGRRELPFWEEIKHL